MNIKTLLSTSAVILASAAGASAQPFVMGYSGGDPNYLDVTTTSAGVIDLSTSTAEINSGTLNQGWWSATFANYQGNDNHFTGVNGVDALNSYYIFDLDALNDIGGGPVTSATLVLNDPGDNGSPPFDLSFWDVSTPATSLVNYSTPTSAAIYNDLGSGVEYGSLAYGGGGTITVTLDSAALAAINGGSGYFAIGATLTPSAGVPDAGATLGLLGLSMSCLMSLRRKK